VKYNEGDSLAEPGLHLLDTNSDFDL